MAARKTADQDTAAARKTAGKTAASKTARGDQIFAVEVEPGLFVYSLSHKLPAASRKIVDKMVAEGAERTREAAAQLRQLHANRLNGASANGAA
jgi:hypothetical protein